jgi:hypothetical protein
MLAVPWGTRLEGDPAGAMALSSPSARRLGPARGLGANEAGVEWACSKSSSNPGDSELVHFLAVTQLLVEEKTTG